MNKLKPLNAVVVIVGAAIIFLGLNIGLGGIKTFGWQSSRDFVAITDAAVFGAQDSHIRLLGGIWFGIGAVFLAGGFALPTLRQTPIVLSCLIPIAGLFRLSGMNLDVIFSAAVAPSLALELVGFPLLAWCLVVSAKREV